MCENKSCLWLKFFHFLTKLICSFVCWELFIYIANSHIFGCCAQRRRGKQNSRRLVEEFVERIASTLNSPGLFFFFGKNSFMRHVIYLRSSSRTQLNSYKYPKRAATESLWQGKMGGIKREQHRQKWREALETFKAIPGVWRRGRWPVAYRKESISSLTIGRSHKPEWFNANRNVRTTKNNLAISKTKIMITSKWC